MEQTTWTKVYKCFRKKTCRGFQSEAGKEYAHDVPVRLCERGCRACNEPIDALVYYSPCWQNRATGHKSAVSATGYKSAVRATGCKSAVSATGLKSAASATGAYSVVSATGDCSEASVFQTASIAVAWGIESKASGVIGSYLVLSDWRVVESKVLFFGAKLFQVDGVEVKDNTFYKLIGGELVACND